MKMSENYSTQRYFRNELNHDDTHPWIAVKKIVVSLKFHLKSKNKFNFAGFESCNQRACTWALNNVLYF